MQEECMPAASLLRIASSAASLLTPIRYLGAVACCLPVIALCSTAPALAQSKLLDENLISPVPTGFQIGMHANNGPMTIAEFVPDGETVKDWSKMVTVQIFHNLHGVDPDAFSDGMKTRWLAACAGSEVHKIKNGLENGYPFSLYLYACPLNPATSKPENMFAKVISGSDSLYSVQFAYKIPLDTEIITPTMTYLGSIKVCDTRLPDRPCPPGM
jgi:hypothetical protein